MKRSSLLLSLAAITLSAGAAPALADNKAAAKNSALSDVLNAEFRAEDKERDQHRNPAKTLSFFQVKPAQTVVEYSPGGGWYTRVLAPYIAPNGKYIAMNGDSSARNFDDRAREARAKGWTENFPGRVEEWTGVSADKVTAFELDEIPDEMAGTADRVLVFRSMHGLLNRNSAQATLKAFRKILKGDGMVGVVQHRAPTSESYERSNGSRGYITEKRTIDLFSLHGFELVGKSEVNANPKDKADYERGVWHLFPTRIFDKENDEKYRPIGESDRMTLLFRKKP